MMRMLLALMLCAGPVAASAQVPAAAELFEVVPDSGDTAWVLASSALVLLMTLPGLALFYGGLVRAQNFLSVLVHCMAITALVSLFWAVIGYSLTFGDGPMLVGAGLNFMLKDLGVVREGTTVPESAFALFQMTFAVITPALIVGAVVERVRFGWLMLFVLFWSLLVYVPVARAIWGGGWLAQMNVTDFAGGLVVHTTAGVSALVLAVMLGRRSGFPRPMLPHAPALTLAGAGLLWVGWFGFNGGSALGASDDAASAILNTHLAASAAALAWALVERVRLGKTTAVGIATGAIAGLATITPAALYVAPSWAMMMGLAGGLVCFFAVGLVKRRFAIDDSLDVFAVHGVGGILGSLLVAVFMAESFAGGGLPDGMTMASQLGVQALAVAVVALWSALGTVIVGYGLAMALPMRISAEGEREGLDRVSHGERAWDIDGQ